MHFQRKDIVELLKNIDKKVFFPALIILIVIIIPLYFFPEKSNTAINAVFSYCTDKLGWMYILICLLSFIFLIWITVSKYGNIRLGEENEKPQFSNFSWVSMLFTAGVGTSIIILGFLEPIYYASEPPFHLAAYSNEAYEYAHMYGQFHWGLCAWAFYVPAIVAVAFTIFVKKKEKLSLSSACLAVLPAKCRKLIGALIDIFVVFGIVGSISTSLGLGTPVLSLVIRNIFGLPEDFDFILRIIIIIIWVFIFGTSVYLGLEKGIQNLSNFNIALAAVFMTVIFIFGPTGDFVKMELNSLGLYANNFIRMLTWTDPFGDGAFVEEWTVFYWGWWMAFMPMMGIFIARISRGRTIKNVVWGQLLWGTLGCVVSFMIFGGYSLYLQKNNILDVAYILENQGQGAAILAILQTLPLSKIMMILFCILCFLYLATTIDSCAYVLAATTTKKLNNKEEPARWNRILWAIIFCVLSIGLMIIGGLKAIQTISIIAGLPLIAVSLLLMASTIKMLKEKS